MTPLNLDKYTATILTIAAVLTVVNAFISNSSWVTTSYAFLAAWLAWRVVWIQEE